MPRNGSCGSYGPGHLMPWIQAKKSHEDPLEALVSELLVSNTDW